MMEDEEDRAEGEELGRWTRKTCQHGLKEHSSCSEMRRRERTQVKMQGYTAIKRSTLERCYPPVETAQNLTPRPGAEGYVKLCSFPVFRCAWNRAMTFTHLHLSIYIQMNWYTNITSRN